MTKRGVFDEMSTTQQHAVRTGTRIVQSNSCDFYPYREESASSFHLEKWLSTEFLFSYDSLSNLMTYVAKAKAEGDNVEPVSCNFCSRNIMLTHQT